MVVDISICVQDQSSNMTQTFSCVFRGFDIPQLKSFIPSYFISLQIHFTLVSSDFQRGHLFFFNR